jgi:PhzF family phenazine biosynthesis protein
MKIPLFQVDAFTSRLFGGNPAAVCPLEAWLDERTMQSIAAENNLAETAFFVGGGGRYDIRWFTPMVEVDLCGHATLASAFVIFTRLEPGLEAVSFRSKGGELRVTRSGDRLTLDFPAWPPARREVSEAVGLALGAAPREVWESHDLMAVYDSEEDVRRLAPAMDRVAALDAFAVIATAPARTGPADFVSRFFAPRQGIPEDPVTGRAHCTLVPYWSRRLGKAVLHAVQLSRRGGDLFCEDRGDRVAIGGHAVQFLEGTIQV